MEDLGGVRPEAIDFANRDTVLTPTHLPPVSTG